MHVAFIIISFILFILKSISFLIQLRVNHGLGYPLKRSVKCKERIIITKMTLKRSSLIQFFCRSPIWNKKKVGGLFKIKIFSSIWFCKEVRTSCHII